MPRKYEKREPEFPMTAEEGQSAAEPEAEKPATPAPLPPPPPNPAVIALQGDIVTLIRQRSEIRRRVLEAHAAVLNAQNVFQIAQSEMKGLEDEVQYLHSQCSQLEGRQDVRYSVAPDYSTPVGAVDLSAISSVPTSAGNVQAINRAADGVNRGHASREMY